MNLNSILNIVQIVIAVLLVATILFQQRGAGLGSAFGGGGGEGGVYYKKRGMEKIIFTATVVLAVLFILIAFIRMLI
jgi:protein translocase SecG subunit